MVHTLDHNLSKSLKVKMKQKKKKSPGHTCLFPLPFFSSFLLFPLAALRFPLLFRFWSFSVRFLYLLLPLSIRFLPALRGGGFCSFVSELHPPRAASEPASMRILLACCLFLAGTAMLSPRFRFLLRLVEHTYDVFV